MVDQGANSKPKKAKKTTEDILKDLEENGLDKTPVGLGPWSHSKLKTLRSCPLKFYLQYVLKIKAGEPEVSLITEVGKASHRILELVLGGKDIDRAYSMARKEFQDTISDSDWADMVASVEYNIVKFKEKVDEFEKIHGVKRIFQEIRIGVTKDWEPTGFFSDDVYYRGVIDLAIQLKNGDLLLIDHKYGTSSQMGLRNFQDQLDTYKVLFHMGIEKIEGSQAGIHHIKEGAVALDDYVEKEDIEKSLVQRIEFSIQGAIDALEDIGYFKHIAHSGCKYCDYKDACKAGNLKEMERDSKKWFEIKKAT